jgi:hypothetical protein
VSFVLKSSRLLADATVSGREFQRGIMGRSYKDTFFRSCTDTHRAAYRSSCVHVSVSLIKVHGNGQRKWTRTRTVYDAKYSNAVPHHKVGAVMTDSTTEQDNGFLRSWGSCVTLQPTLCLYVYVYYGFICVISCVYI